MARLRVTLIRHGEAGDDAARDEHRALTKRGRADARRVGRALLRAGVRFGAVVTSPLVRAVQTAEIVLCSMGGRARVTVSESLVPDARADRVVALLGSLVGEKSVALVAHEPILSAVAAALLGVPRFQALRKGEAIRIRLLDGLAGPGQLRWRVDPESGRRKRV